MATRRPLLLVDLCPKQNLWTAEKQLTPESDLTGIDFQQITAHLDMPSTTEQKLVLWTLQIAISL